jgi:hypothetical protein
MLLQARPTLSFTEHARRGIMGIVSWNDPATRWIDGLSTVTRLLVWAGVSLAAAFTVVLVEHLISGGFLGWSWAVLFAIVMTASGFAGSTIRNRNGKRSRV